MTSIQTYTGMLLLWHETCMFSSDPSILWLNPGMFWTEPSMFWPERDILWFDPGKFWSYRGMFWIDTRIFWSDPCMFGRLHRHSISLYAFLKSLANTAYIMMLTAELARMHSVAKISAMGMAGFNDSPANLIHCTTAFGKVSKCSVMVKMRTMRVPLCVIVWLVSSLCVCIPLCTFPRTDLIFLTCALVSMIILQ